MGFLGLGDGGKSLPAAGWATSAKPCDTCKYAAALLFCRAESLFLCVGCDSKLHNHARRHERVWLCEVCEQAPATVTCKADAAALCVTCDRDIHTANPLARRHERVPVVPFYDAVIKSAGAAGDNPIMDNSHGEVPSSWIELPGSGVKLLPEAPDMKSIDFFLSDSDQFIDFDFTMAMNARFHHEQHNLGSDSVVPVHQTVNVCPAIQTVDHSPDNHFEIDFSKPKLNSYSNTFASHSLNHSLSVSSSSMDVGVVPEGSSMSEMSCPFPATIDGCGSGSTMTAPLQLSGMDREARVLRYREKRKNRKFEKTIRYASRKAYAETRPRIKGRFAKRTEVESEVDNFFGSGSSIFLSDAGYGVVPSF